MNLQKNLGKDVENTIKAVRQNEGNTRRAQQGKKREKTTDKDSMSRNNEESMGRAMQGKKHKEDIDKVEKGEHQQKNTEKAEDMSNPKKNTTRVQRVKKHDDVTGKILDFEKNRECLCKRNYFQLFFPICNCKAQ